MKTIKVGKGLKSKTTKIISFLPIPIELDEKTPENITLKQLAKNIFKKIGLKDGNLKINSIDINYEKDVSKAELKEAKK